MHPSLGNNDAWQTDMASLWKSWWKFRIRRYEREVTSTSSITRVRDMAIFLFIVLCRYTIQMQYETFYIYVDNCQLSKTPPHKCFRNKSIIVI